MKKALWEQEKQNLNTEYGNDTELDNVHRTIADAGHDTELMTAEDDMYESLPACCKYRDSADE